MKYSTRIYNIVKEHAEWNGYGIITDSDIDKLTRKEVLRRFLEWEGILGYTETILSILDIK